MGRLGYVPGGSLLHRLHPVCKLLLLIIYTGVVWTNARLSYGRGSLASWSSVTGLLDLASWAGPGGSSPSAS